VVVDDEDSFAGRLNDGAHSSVVVVLVHERAPHAVLLRLDQARVPEVGEAHADVVGVDERRQLTHAVHRQFAAPSARRHQLASGHLVVAADRQRRTGTICYLYTGGVVLTRPASITGPTSASDDVVGYG